MSLATMRIGEVATRTGLTPATIRAWERRYGLLAPRRTGGGQRLYSEADVAALQAVRTRVEDGWAVAAAAAPVTGADPAPEPPPVPGSPAPGSHRPVAGDAAGRARLLTEVEATSVRAGPAAAALGPESHDVVALLATLNATRAVLRAPGSSAVVAALIDLVVQLGGAVEPGSVEGDHVVPIDLGLGEIDPVVACAEPFSLARLRLEAVLPGVVEDARRMVALLRGAAG